MKVNNFDNERSIDPIQIAPFHLDLHCAMKMAIPVFILNSKVLKLLITNFNLNVVSVQDKI